MHRIQLSFLLFCMIGAVIISSCSPSVIKRKWTKKEAPEYFTARFETTKGSFDIEARREWSPMAVDRLYRLIGSGFFSDVALYRVVPDFVVQFGIADDSVLNNAWRAQKVPDEPVVEKNEAGTISFARAGKETRSTQIFINLKSNSPYLDETSYGGVTGFPVVAKVIGGMDVIEQFYAGYAEQPTSRQGEIQSQGNSFLKENYPKLDYIKEAYLLK